MSAGSGPLQALGTLRRAEEERAHAALAAAVAVERRACAEEEAWAARRRRAAGERGRFERTGAAGPIGAFLLRYRVLLGLLDAEATALFGWVRARALRREAAEGVERAVRALEVARRAVARVEEEARMRRAEAERRRERAEEERQEDGDRRRSGEG